MTNIEYIDLVICKLVSNGKNYLFRAPAFSHLTKGDQVIVTMPSEEVGLPLGAIFAKEPIDTSVVEHFALVEACCTVGNGDSCFEALCRACNAKLPLNRVESRVVYDKFDYTEGGEA